MSQSPSKFISGSALAHGAVLSLLVFGPAFEQRPSSDETVELKMVDVIASKVIDSAFASGGGTPKPQPATPQPPKVNPPPQAPPAEPAPQKQEPPKPEPVKQPDTPKVKKPKPETVKPEPVKPEPEPEKTPKIKVAKDPISAPKHPPIDNPDSVKPATRKIDVAKNAVKPSASELESAKQARDQERRERETTERRQRETREATDRRQRDLREQLSSVANSARSSASSLDKRLSSTKIEMPSGSGGEAYISYHNLLFNIYQPRWDRGRPDAVVEDFAAVKAAITIARDGRVLNSRIIQSSGIPAVDKAADTVLKSVNFIAPFPETAKASEMERTFTISFTVKGRSEL